MAVEDLVDARLLDCCGMFGGGRREGGGVGGSLMYRRWLNACLPCERPRRQDRRSKIRVVTYFETVCTTD